MERRQFISLVTVPVVLGEVDEVAAIGKPETLVLKDTGVFPNSAWPALVYSGVFATSSDLASQFEALFAKNGWTGSWRNGLYRVHHYHSTAHEVLGIYRGSVRARLGGPDGRLVTLKAGDVAILPAGVAHKNEGQSDDFAVVGAYPTGTSPDLQYGKDAERPRTDKNIAAVPHPSADPVAGKNGALMQLWR